MHTRSVVPCPSWTEQVGGNPVEERSSALLRAGLVWRWLAEPSRTERNIAVVTHSKLIKKSGNVCTFFWVFFGGLFGEERYMGGPGRASSRLALERYESARAKVAPCR